MKKLFSLILAVVMVVTLSFGVFAAPTDLSGVVTGLGKTTPIVRNIDVPVDMKVEIMLTVRRN